jgi:hypothetical protein
MSTVLDCEGVAMMRRLLLVLACLSVLVPDVFAGAADPGQQQENVKQITDTHKWQTDPQEFAKLIFGEDLSVRAPRDSATVLREKAKEVIGYGVEWTVTYGVSPAWFGLPEEVRKQLDLGNPGLFREIGLRVSGWMDLYGSRLEGTQKVTWNRMTWGIPPQSDVRLKMRIDGVVALILRNGKLYLSIEGSQLQIETTIKRCEWPGYGETVAAPVSAPSALRIGAPPEVRVTNAYGFPIKAGLRSGDRGLDFIVPANGSASRLVPPGKYSIYFQFGADPESLFIGDDFAVDSTGVEIRLKESGDYHIRKIKGKKPMLPTRGPMTAGSRPPAAVVYSSR